MQLRKATRQKARIRLGLSAVSGGGKTYSALLIAYGMTSDWSKIAIIDSENGSADLYDHLGDYNVLPLEAPFSPERYIQAIDTCEKAGIEVIIIDSITHEWDGAGGILEIVDKLGGEYQSGWKKATPRHDAFKHRILFSPCHIITTVRRKQDYILQEKRNKAGNTVMTPVKNGLKEVTREGWEYELTINLELNIEHLATASKDRTGLFDKEEPFVPSIETGQLIRDWCEKGIDPRLELEKAINDLVDCHTVEDLTSLKKQLPDYVVNRDEFKSAGLNRYNEIVNQAINEPTVPEPDNESDSTQTPTVSTEAIKPGSLGVNITDQHGKPVDVGKFLTEANTVEQINSVLRWLRIKKEEGWNVKAWQDAIHDKAITTLKLTFRNADQLYYPTVSATENVDA